MVALLEWIRSFAGAYESLAVSAYLYPYTIFCSLSHNVNSTLRVNKSE